MNKDSKIYISGHRGMTGSAMLKHLQNDGYSNLLVKKHSELDLTKQSEVESFFEKERPEYVFHIAAKMGGIMENKKYPVEYLSDGILITLNVLNAAHKYDSKGVVFVSSVKAYPINAPIPISEECFLNGRMDIAWENYGMAKAVGMKFCENVACQFGKRFISAVFPSIYGENNYGTTVMPMLADKFADAVLNKKKTVEIWGTGNAKRDFVYSYDAADAMLFLMEKGGNGEKYNVSSGEEKTIRELAEILKEISGFKGELVFDSTKPESSQRQLLDGRKILDLGWHPKALFKNGVEKVYREHFERMKNLNI